MAPSRVCPFCGVEASILSNERAYAIFDRAPVAPGHVLTLPHAYVGRLARGLAAPLPDPRSRIRPELPRLAWAGEWSPGTQPRNFSRTAPATVVDANSFPAIR
jgi:hypothetical protein